MTTETLPQPPVDEALAEKTPTATEKASDAGVADVVNAVIADVERQRSTQRLPTATYRVQFNSRCTFRDVEAAIPYLYSLGVSDLYCSPFLQARPGSPHGYDVVNHAAINAEIGTLEDLRSLRSTLREHDKGLIADVVPNHMAADPQLNVWWQDVLENGPSSAFASHFDIDWTPPKPDLAHKVLLPVLGDQFGKVLEDGQLSVAFTDGMLWLNYFDQRFPLSPRSYAVVLALRIDELTSVLGPDSPDLQELLSIITAIKNLPPRTEVDPDRLAERRREKEVVKRRLHELCQRSERVAEFIHDNVALINGRRGESRSFDRLDELLQDQAYRLAFWRVASDEINYRRFFDINELAAICTEHPQVFAESHRFLFDLIDQGIVTGLRIDHPDGLYDPRGYFVQLQEHHFLRLCREAFDRGVGRAPFSGEDWTDVERRLLELWRSAAEIVGSPLSQTLYVVVEKILMHGERLPDDWPVHGTVGYEFLNAANGVFVDPRGQRPLSNLYSRFTSQSLDFEELAYQSKRLIVRMSMASELNVLGNRLDRISERNRWTRDFTLNSLTRALQEVIACFQVYRTYVQPGRVLERDRRCIDEAVAYAKRRNPAMDASIFDFVHDVLVLRFRDNADDEERRATERFVGKFQQLTGPIMAKAVEDTMFYRFNRLVSLNEVGGEPHLFGTSPDEFHRLNQSRLPRYAHALNASSTHDTKRSEDVRARINVLSEIPKEWREHVQRWSRWNRKLKTSLDGHEAPSRNAEYLLYQTLVAIWPDEIPTGDDRTAFCNRLQQYMLKVVREAKVFTSWVSPNEPYETAVARFVAGLFNGPRRQPFLKSLHEFAGHVADHGRWNSLAQLLLKIASPGVPDIYQGAELWLLTLVDPDNRHPVDFHARRQILDGLLEEMATALGLADRTRAVDAWLAPDNDAPDDDLLQRLLAQRRDGRLKMFVTLLALRARRQFPDLFAQGDYEPLAPSGQHAEHLLAFARRRGDVAAVVAVPRFSARLAGFGGPPPTGDVFGDTAIPLPADLARRRLWNVFTREVAVPNAEGRLPASTAFRRLPLCLLIARESA
jgi:(1->4)-alpha-D-glucan 1-alpha-D-glucosylmutase